MLTTAHEIAAYALGRSETPSTFPKQDHRRHEGSVDMIEERMNSLLQFLRASFRAVGEAHRTNPRRHVCTPARLTWTDGEKQQTIRGRLVDISRAGAALVTAAVPPRQTHARIRLVGAEPTPWIEADILGVEPESPTRHRVRLRFSEPCPTYFLRVAVLGPVAQDEAAKAGCPAAGEPLDLAIQPSSPSSTGSIA
jgi:hypothetical protein